MKAIRCYNIDISHQCLLPLCRATDRAGRDLAQFSGVHGTWFEVEEAGDQVRVYLVGTDRTKKGKVWHESGCGMTVDSFPFKNGRFPVA